MPICSNLIFEENLNVYYLKLKRESDLHPSPQKNLTKQTIINFFGFQIIWIVTAIEQFYQHSGSLGKIDQDTLNCTE